MNNVFDDLPQTAEAELFTELLARPGLRIERIVSTGQVTPPEAPYDQSRDEWILLLAGSARLWTERTGERTLHAGDFLLIPAHERHRVTWTAPDRPTVWLAIHFG
jgi:cupin 2 domain-containing protein